MLIALVGPPCAGKHEVARYLIIHHLFVPAFILPRAPVGTSSDADNGLDADSLHPQSQALLDLCYSSRGHEMASSSADGSQQLEQRYLFESAQDLLDYSTARWRTNIVTLDLRSADDLEVGFDKRPFFLLAAVQAPLGVRWGRFKRRAKEDAQAQALNGVVRLASPESTPATLEEFVAQDDLILWGYSDAAQEDDQPMLGATQASTSSLSPHSSPRKYRGEPLMRSPSSGGAGVGLLGSSTARASHQVLASGKISAAPPQAGLSALLHASTVKIHNPFSSLPSLHASLSTLSPPLTSPLHLRPSWDLYFLSLCTLASLRSNCMKRRVGAVLVRANRVLSTGYNGTPRGLVNCNEGGCGRCNSAASGGTLLDECLCLHAEENALLECGRERGGAEGTVLYCNTCPCLRCAVKIVQTGVREVVYQLEYSMDRRSKEIFDKAGVGFRRMIG